MENLVHPEGRTGWSYCPISLTKSSLPFPTSQPNLCNHIIGSPRQEDLPMATGWAAERRSLKSVASSSIAPHTLQTPPFSLEKNFSDRVSKGE